VKLIAIDRRNADIQLRKGVVYQKPDHIQMQVINFIKRNYSRPFETPLNITTEKEVCKFLVKKFLQTSPNLKHMFGIIYKTIDNYFYYADADKVSDKKVSLPTSRRDDIKSGQLSFTFEDYFFRG
jgi:hypothetical protein